MAESIIKEDNYTCKQFYTGFLDPMSLDLRKEAVTLFHDLGKHHGTCTKEQCSDVIIKMELELGTQHLCCEVVAKEFAECLRKNDLLEDAVDFLNNRLIRLGSKDFGSLIALGDIYEKAGDYRKASGPRKAALQLAKEADDPVLINLALLKQACNLWHSKNVEKAKENVSLCLSKKHYWPTPSQFPFNETTFRLIDMYKTLGYIHFILEETTQSAEYYIKALRIVEQDNNAIIHQLQLETQIAKGYCKLKSQKTEEYCARACARMKEIECDEDFLTHHVLTVIHCVSRLAHSLQIAGLFGSVLEVRELSYTIAVKHLDENHPEVARIAADTAYLCCLLDDKQVTNIYSEKGNIYADRAKSALANTTEMELDFLKLHVRELSDAWKSLGYYYAKLDDFEECKKCFDESLTVNRRVYGLSHPRLARLYNTLGFFYKRSGRFSEANSFFRKCKEINDEFYPNDNNLRKKVQIQIHMTNSLDKKFYRK